MRNQTSRSTEESVSTTRSRPEWYAEEHESAWDRVKAAMANDWEQTKNDFGSDSARDLDQDVDDTVKQAAGSDDAFENHEQALRFGHAAEKRYGSDHPSWNGELESRLRKDYPGDYDSDREDIRYAYEYRQRH